MGRKLNKNFHAKNKTVEAMTGACSFYGSCACSAVGDCACKMEDATGQYRRFVDFGNQYKNSFLNSRN